MRLSLVLLLPALAVAAPVPKAKEAAPPPCPMTVGDTREYEYRVKGGVEEAHSDVVTKVEKQKDGSTNVTFRRTVTKAGQTIVVINVSESGMAQLNDGDIEFATPQVLLKLPAEKGTKWELNDVTFEVVAEEEVKVGAGTYKAAKVEMVSKGGKMVLWYAPGVGLVKFNSGSERTLELKAFKPGK